MIARDRDDEPRRVWMIIVFPSPLATHPPCRDSSYKLLFDLDQHGVSEDECYSHGTLRLICSSVSEQHVSWRQRADLLRLVDVVMEEGDEGGYTATLVDDDPYGKYVRTRIASRSDPTTRWFDLVLYY